MNKILVIGRHEEMMKKVLLILEEEGFDGISSFTDQEALETFEKLKPQAVLIGGGVEQESRKLFHMTFGKSIHKQAIIDVYPYTIREELKKLKVNGN